MIALVGMAGLWYWTRFDAAPQTAAPQSAAMRSAELPGVRPIAQVDPSPGAGGIGDDQKPRVSRSLNWGLYAGTMQDQVQKALADRNGPMAAELAARLQTCDINLFKQAYRSSLGGDSSADPAIQAIQKERLQEEQRQISACQAVAGDHAQVRLQLLNVAVEQKVFGAADAAFQAGVGTPDVLNQVVRDATEGHATSLYNVATYNPTVFGIDAETQSAVRYALKIASADPSVGPGVSGLLESSEKIAPFWANEKSSTYDYSKMSDAARKEGTVIGARLVQQLTKPKS